jgi:hypothetical protein
MAEPLAGTSALQLLEDAAHLLRRASFATLAWHWIGSAPFALAALLFWSVITRPGLASGECALGALVVTLLLVWMNCCRAVFAARLRRQLSDSDGPDWSVRRIWEMAATQAFLGATRLGVMPLAVLTSLPLAHVVSFYRIAAALAGHEELPPAGVIRKAREYSGFRPSQSWLALALLFFIFIVVAANVAIVLAVLPLLARTLTGYESQFSRSGVYFVANWGFWLSALALSWIAFDPFVQAVYCVRCFQAESEKSGEDLRVGLRAIRAVHMVVAALLLLSIPPMQAAGTVSPEELGASVRQVMQSPEYDWRIPPPAAPAAGTSWIVSVTNRIIDASGSALSAARDAIRRFLRWIFGSPSASPASKGGLPVLLLPLEVWLCIFAVLIVAMVIAAWRRASAGSRVSGLASEVQSRSKPATDDLSPLRFPEEEWIGQADNWLREGNWRFAVRALYLASLVWLGRRSVIAIHPGKTNREYSLELRRRTRSVPQVRHLFAGNVAAFESSWYGMHDLDAAAVADFRRSIDEMKKSLEASA